MIRSRLVFAFVGLAALSLALVAWRPAPAAPSLEDPAPAARAAVERGVTVVLVRHAEKATGGDPRDPELSEAGQRRASALARVLGSAGVTHAFASEYRRTQATLAPLATAAKVRVAPMPAAKPEELVAALRGLPAGSVAVVAGHSNTVPELARRLGAPLAGLAESKGAAVLPEDAFDRVYVITLPPRGVEAPPNLLELRYGDG